MNREVLDRWCERGILSLMLAVLVFGPLAMGAVRTPEFAIIQGLVLGAAALWLVRLWLNPRPQLLWPPIGWAVLAFAAYAVVRYLTADIEYLARQELRRVLTYTLIFFVVINNLHRQGSVRIIAFTLIFLGMAVSFYAFYQFLAGSDRVWTFVSPYKHRASGTYISPNHLAGFLEMLLPLGLAYTMAGRLKPLTKVFLGYASLVMVAGLGVTLSRGGWLACGIALLFFFGLLFLRRHYRLPTLLLALVVLAGAGLFASKSERFQSRFKHAFFDSPTGQSGEDIRFELWHPAVRVWRDHFWFGAGPAHFDYRFRVYRPQVVQKRPDRVHNDYLNTLADWGIVGAALVASAWLLLYLGVVKTWKFVRGHTHEFSGNQSNRFAFVLGASIGLLALLLHSVVDFNMHIPANAILAVSLMALLGSHLRFATNRHWKTARPWAQWLILLSLLTVMVYLGDRGWRAGREYVWLRRAALTSYASPDQIALLKKAFALEPNNFETAYALGEAYRVESWEGSDRFAELARQAMDWYDRSLKLNPFYAESWMRYGMCLDWLGRHDEAWRYFVRAEQLDPNNNFVIAHVGWHYMQIGNYAAARSCFERSLSLESQNNMIAFTYLEIAKRRLAQGATPIRLR